MDEKYTFMTQNQIPEKLEMLYEGKAKIIYKTSDPKFLIQYFKDDTTAFNNKKFAIIKNKGILNNEISSLIMQKLKDTIKTHFICKINDREQLIMPVKIIPLEVVVRNVMSGNFAKTFGLEAGKPLKNPLIEFFYKKDELNDPAISPNQIIALEIITLNQISILEDYAIKINNTLKAIFEKAGFVLADFKLEFGFAEDGEIILADEISPDSCRLWDKETGKSFDKDVFRKDLGDISVYYAEVLKRLQNSL